MTTYATFNYHPIKGKPRPAATYRGMRRNSIARGEVLHALRQARRQLWRQLNLAERRAA